MRKQITHGHYVRATQPQRQLLGVVGRFDLYKTQHPFTRCMHCNGEIRPAPKPEIKSRLLPRTKARHNEFWQCAQCNKIYWQGSHYERMQQLIKSINESQLTRGTNEV